MNINPYFSIFIPVYNKKYYLKECIESLCETKVSVEIILVDDGSNDEYSD